MNQNPFGMILTEYQATMMHDILEECKKEADTMSVMFVPHEDLEGHYKFMTDTPRKVRKIFARYNGTFFQFSYNIVQAINGHLNTPKAYNAIMLTTIRLRRVIVWQYRKMMADRYNHNNIPQPLRGDDNDREAKG